MNRFHYHEQRLPLDANLELAKAAEARKTKPRRITRISEARKIAQGMLNPSWSETSGFNSIEEIAICWDAEEGSYKCIPDNNHRAKNVVERVR